MTQYTFQVKMLVHKETTQQEAKEFLERMLQIAIADEIAYIDRHAQDKRPINKKATDLAYDTRFNVLP